MIKILKDGEIPKPTKVIYKTTCQNCGCIFEFETEDFKSIERRIDGYRTVECPCCHKDITKASFAFKNGIVGAEENEQI